MSGRAEPAATGAKVEESDEDCGDLKDLSLDDLPASPPPRSPAPVTPPAKAAANSTAVKVEGGLPGCSGLDVDLDKAVVEQCELPSDHSPENAMAFVVRGVFSAEECKKLIKGAEGHGFGRALVNVGGGRQRLIADYRNSKRCMLDDETTAAWMWERIKRFVPKEYRAHKPAGLNERLRFLKYHPGDFFAAHFDGTYVRQSGPKEGEISLLTLLVYLNEDYEGGRTTLLDRFESEHLPVEPTTGSILITQHDVYHEAAMLTKGIKYAIRTDIMFHPNEHDLRWQHWRRP